MSKLPSFQNTLDIETAMKDDAVNARKLHAVWLQRQPVEIADKHKRSGPATNSLPQIAWLQEDLRLVERFTAHALEQEEFWLVCDAVTEAREHWTKSGAKPVDLVRLTMHHAQALTRLGATRNAGLELEPLLDAKQYPVGNTLRADILLQLGNNMRDESQHASTKAAKQQAAKEALSFYEKSLELIPDRLPAMALAAAAALWIGGPGSALYTKAKQRAERIIKLAANLDADRSLRTAEARAWATAHAVLGQLDKAAKRYEALQTMPDINTRELADARHYSGFLAGAWGKPQDFFKKNFPPLELIVFAGHLPDQLGGPERFPAEAIPRARAKIREKLKSMQARVGLVSAAAGSDLLFIDEMLKRDGTVHLVLPWSREEFRETSVRKFDSKDSNYWEQLFDNTLSQAASIHEIGQAYLPNSEVGWAFTMEFTAGLALHTARVRRLDLQPLVLWDEEPGWLGGGTASFVGFWENRMKCKPAVIKLPRLGECAMRNGARSAPRCEQPTFHQKVKSMLFADIVGYSKLKEESIQSFVESFLSRVSQVAATSKYAPSTINTWGDAVYATFDYAHDAGCFALELIQMIKENDKVWMENRLSWQERVDPGQEAVAKPLDIRIGLHTGPVFMIYDPVVRRLSFTGSHVSRAARIEPITRPGEVFASEEFAALAELGKVIERDKSGDGSDGFVCEYAGSMELAKGYPGRFRIYRVLPKREFAIEELAKAAHELYCKEIAKNPGEKPPPPSSLLPWETLADDLKEANRAQVSDIPNKLRALSYELAPSYGLSPAEIKITREQLEELAQREHDRWVKERESRGWVYGPKRDNARLIHPAIVPWHKLSEPDKKKDRDTIENLPKLIQKAGFKVRKIPSGGGAQ